MASPAADDVRRATHRNRKRDPFAFLFVIAQESSERLVKRDDYKKGHPRRPQKVRHFKDDEQAMITRKR